MAGLGDPLTIGILLSLIFGAVGFYLYSRIGQNEKRVNLLENLLLSLKLNTEASLNGPDSIEPVSMPAPLAADDVDGVDEEEYATLAESVNTPVAPAPAPAPAAAAEADEEEAAAALLRALTPSEPRKMDLNYEAMSLKELQTLARQRGLSGVPQRKRDLIESLKKQVPAAAAATASAEVFDGVEVQEGADFTEQ